MQDVFDDNAGKLKKTGSRVAEDQILDAFRRLKNSNRKHDGRDIRWQIVSEHRSLVLMDQKV
jgi:hypothetical protein